MMVKICKQRGEETDARYSVCLNCAHPLDGSQPKKVSTDSRAREAKKLERQEVVVVDMNMPFWSMVEFMVKWAIASIPAFIILAILGFILSSVFAGVLGGFSHRF
jgi:hypothetical protein